MTMQRKNTAKFGQLRQQSFINRFNTEQTENFEKSYIDVLNNVMNNNSNMNVSELQLPKDQSIYVNGNYKITDNYQSQNGNSLYKCPICERLRVICPYKNYKTYEYCKNCAPPVQRKTQKFFNQSKNTTSKGLDSTLDNTKGHLKTQIHQIGGHYQMQQVDKVRFPQSGGVYPLKLNTSKQTLHPSPHFFSNQIHRQRIKTTAQTSYSNGRDNPSYPFFQNQQHQSTIKFYPPIPAPAPLNQEIIFYPIIHNKLVYRSASRSNYRPGQQRFEKTQKLGKTQKIGRTRYMSSYENRSKQDLQKVVSDFLVTTQADQFDLIKPNDLRKLANSMYRANHNNNQQESLQNNEQNTIRYEKQ